MARRKTWGRSPREETAQAALDWLRLVVYDTVSKLLLEQILGRFPAEVGPGTGATGSASKNAAEITGS
jgi:hypothetical protein